MIEPLPGQQIYEIGHEADVMGVRRAMKAFALGLGFVPQTAEELALVVVELGTNLLRHAGGGRLMISALNREGRVGVQVESVDEGPGIPSVDEALADGFSTRGGCGTGLGTVNRLMDSMEIDTRHKKGTRIVCLRWVRVVVPAIEGCPLSIGVATRPKDEVNGDEFVAKTWGGAMLVGVIDGCGHGPLARRAAVAARQYVETHYELDLVSIFEGVERACRGTRGVVMALARFHWLEGRVEFASVGNISTRVLRGSKDSAGPSLAVRRGIIGVQAPRALETRFEWSRGHILVMHSDGVGTHWEAATIQELRTQGAEVMASTLLRSMGRSADDATVVVVVDKKVGI